MIIYVLYFIIHRTRPFLFYSSQGKTLQLEKLKSHLVQDIKDMLIFRILMGERSFAMSVLHVELTICMYISIHLRGKTLQFEKLKSHLVQDVEDTENEEEKLKEYKNELDLLTQEKMAHVEELRQIHADMNAVRGVIRLSLIIKQNSKIVALN